MQLEFDDVDGVAATVVLLRDGEAGPEVLLLERPDRGAFAGAWVFPGGALERVDVDGDDLTPDDPDEEERAARRAAVRETYEETALTLDPSSLVQLSRWYPPREAPKRFRTWFYVARDPGGSVTLQADEAVDHRWIRPADALARHEENTLSLFPPTWVTLWELTGDIDVDAALQRIAASEPHVFEGRFAPQQRELFFRDDVAYPDPELRDAEGPRHRISVGTLPWVYERTRGDAV